MSSRAFELVEKWLADQRSPKPDAAALATYLTERVERDFPARYDAAGNVVEPAGRPPFHAYFSQAALRLARLTLADGDSPDSP